MFSNRNIFESYVKELSKMTDKQLDEIDKKLNFKSRRLIQNGLENNNTSNTNLQSIKTQSQNSTIKTLIVNPSSYQAEEYIDDPGFAAVLNQQFILQIEDDIFRVNMIDGFVYVMDQNNQQYLPQLEDSQLHPDVIYRYRMGLPILDILDAGNLGTDPCSIDPYFCSISATPVNPPIICEGCGTPPPSLCDRGQSFENGVCNGCAGTANRKVQNDNEYFVNSIGSDKNRWESKISCQPLGVWFSMISKLEHRTNAPYNGGSNYDPTKPEKSSDYGGTVGDDSKSNIKMMNRTEYNIRKRCKNRDTGSEDSGNGYSADEKKEYRFYNGTRCLKDYCITARFGIFKYMGRTFGGVAM
ncbi:MAG: hypothetical protein H7263_16360, partial [Candidatus Sericytochromatia bacterium]|nr:hypothetical protein [Candidatus Sericytochromatia bacterium]